MRPLVILCEPRHAQAIQANINQFCHPALLSSFVRLISIDTDNETNVDKARAGLVAFIDQVIVGKTEHVLVSASHEVARIIRLRPLSEAYRFEYQIDAASTLVKKQNVGRSLVPMQTLLNRCGLSLRSASVELLRPWIHASLDRDTVDGWVRQFGNKFKWLGEAVLAEVQLINESVLGDRFVGALKAPDALCVNRDPRGTSKSAEIISNILTKRVTERIHQMPAEAIERFGARSVVIFEDGLWSGTEAIGIIESLLGKRAPESRKTQALADANIFRQVEIILLYAVSTDYGTALVKKFLLDQALANVSIQSCELIKVASHQLLSLIEIGTIEIDKVRHLGPTSGLLRPYIESSMQAKGMESDRVDEGIQYLEAIGKQLIKNYLEKMVQNSGWTMWSDDKIDASRLGMHGLGLTHAFAHSVPKASLPVLWGSGTVWLHGQEVNWLPLFKNAS